VNCSPHFGVCLDYGVTRRGDVCSSLLGVGLDDPGGGCLLGELLA
jgi:hypothetical protein